MNKSQEQIILKSCEDLKEKIRLTKQIYVQEKTYGWIVIGEVAMINFLLFAVIDYVPVLFSLLLNSIILAWAVTKMIIWRQKYEQI